MLTLLLVRPGATDYDQQGRIQGTLDIPLSDDGRRQVEGCLEGVAEAKPTAIYTAPCESARQTGALIGQRVGVKPKVLDKLTNLDHGLWQGMLVEEVRTKQPKVYKQWQEKPQTVCPPGGETVLQAKTRVAEALRKLLKKHKEGVVAVVAPEPLTSVIRHVLRHEELSGMWKAAERCGLWEAIEAPAEVTAGVA